MTERRARAGRPDYDVSVGISPRQSFDSWASFTAELERDGVGRIWVIDSQLAMKDVYAGLVVAALNTSRVGLGTGVTNAVTRHPTVTANAMAAVDELSHGRAILGLGAGDSALYGIGLKPQKVIEVEEAVQFFRAKLPSVPIYLAVSQQRMCELAGRVADGAIVMGPAQPDMVRKQVGWIRAGGRDCEVALIAPTSMDVEDVRSWASTQARLLAHFKELPESVARFAAEIKASEETYDYSEHLSTSAEHSQAVSDELVRALAIVGSASECARRLRELKDAGVDTFIFPLAGRGRAARWRRIRDEILAQTMV
ncbi:MAG TPA: LLM class flavin-dependent oxidoreductase [Candidatus Dormibacteraeota bacterium]|nr:LLM class flavin-dependent oxidoreductase [Candidatus Dormibacteraeota bacterium]